MPMLDQILETCKCVWCHSLHHWRQDWFKKPSEHAAFEFQLGFSDQERLSSIWDHGPAIGCSTHQGYSKPLILKRVALIPGYPPLLNHTIPDQLTGTFSTDTLSSLLWARCVDHCL